MLGARALTAYNAKMTSLFLEHGVRNIRHFKKVVLEYVYRKQILFFFFMFAHPQEDLKLGRGSQPFLVRHSKKWL